MPPSRSSPAPAQAPELTSLWCVPTPGARVVGVFARVRVGRALWTHVMRWKPGQRLEHGAWTRLSFRRTHLRLDATGEFLKYHALARTGSPFTGTFGGGSSISRLPYVSALTSISHRSLMMTDSTSDHELSPKDQAALRALFPRSTGAAKWFLHQQPGWQSEPASDTRTRIPNSPFQCFQTEDGPQSDSPLLIATMNLHRLGEPTNRIRFFLTRHEPAEDPVAIHELPVAWAYLRPAGILLTASLQGVLRTYTRERSTDPARKPKPADIPGWRLQTEQPLGDLTPDPQPPPAWAYAPLDGAAPKAAPHNPRATKPGKPRPRRRDRERDW